MKKFLAFSVLAVASVCLLWIPRARTAASDEAEIRQLLDRWAKAFRARDLNGIMSIYEPGQALVAYDIVPPLQYSGFDAYKKDYQEFLDQFQGPIEVEYPDVKIFAGDTIAFSRGLERISGTMPAVVLVANVTLFFEHAQLGTEGGVAGLIGEFRQDLSHAGALQLIEDVHDLALAKYFMPSQPIRERLWPGKISLY